MRAVIESEHIDDIAAPRRHNARLAALFVLAAIIIIAPLSIIDMPLLADYPNHVARMHVIGNLHTNDILQERYDIRLDLVPNLAMDLAVPVLAMVVPLDVAGRLFLAFCLLSTIGSVAFLHRTLFGKWSPYPLVATLFAYHGSLIAGLVNFSLGIGLVPAALAVWIRMQNAMTAWRVLAGGGMMLVLFLCHLVAAGAFGLLLLGYGLARARERRHRRERLWTAASELAVTGAAAILPLLLFLRVLIDKGDSGTQGDLIYGNLAWKLKALLAPLINYNLALDLGSFIFIASLALVLWVTGRLQLDRRLAPGVALLALAFLLSPKALWTGGVFDQRFAVLLALMLVAGTQLKCAKPRLFRVVPIILGALLIVRLAVLSQAWIEHRADLVEIRAAIDKMAEGARLLVVRPDVETAYRLAPDRHRVFHHGVQLQNLPTLAVIEKSAFVSTLYAIAGQQPLKLKPPFDRLGGRGHVNLPTLKELKGALSAKTDGLPVRPQISDWSSDFDYVPMLYGYGLGLDSRTLDLPLEPMLDGEVFDLFRISRT